MLVFISTDTVLSLVKTVLNGDTKTDEVDKAEASDTPDNETESEQGDLPVEGGGKQGGVMVTEPCTPDVRYSITSIIQPSINQLSLNYPQLSHIPPTFDPCTGCQIIPTTDFTLIVFNQPFISES